MIRIALVLFGLSSLISSAGFAAEFDAQNFEANEQIEAVDDATARHWDGDRDDWRYREAFRCEARNRRGMIFYGQARDPRFAQQRAIENCYAFPSRYCQPLGCRRVF